MIICNISVLFFFYLDLNLIVIQQYIYTEGGQNNMNTNYARFHTYNTGAPSGTKVCHIVVVKMTVRVSQQLLSRVSYMQFFLRDAAMSDLVDFQRGLLVHV